MKKVCIWGAWYESSNAGDQAILMTISKLLSEQSGDLDLVVFSNRPEFTTDYMKPVYPVRALSHRHQLPKVLYELASCDLFIVGGGTPFYDDWFHLLAMLLLVMTARLAGKPVMTYAVSSRQITSPLSRLLVWANLLLINQITVREPMAISHFRDFGTSKSVELFTDPAVTLAPSNGEVVQKILSRLSVDGSTDALVAICPHYFSSDEPYRVHHYERFSNEQIEQYHVTLAKAADRLTQQAQVIFLPMNTESPDDDRMTISSICTLMQHGDLCRVVDWQLGPQEIAGVLSKCTLVLAVRLHAAVLSSSVCTPTVAISYGPKVLGYMKGIGQESNTILFNDLTDEALFSVLDRAWHRRIQVRHELDKSMSHMRSLAIENAKISRQLIGRKPAK